MSEHRMQTPHNLEESTQSPMNGREPVSNKAYRPGDHIRVFGPSEAYRLLMEYLPKRDLDTDVVADLINTRILRIQKHDTFTIAIFYCPYVFNIGVSKRNASEDKVDVPERGERLAVIRAYRDYVRHEHMFSYDKSTWEPNLWGTK